MLREITFFAPGTPVTGGSKKGFYVKSLKRVIMAPASKKTKPWMANVRHYAGQAFHDMGYETLFEEPLLLIIEFRFVRPKGHYGTGRNAGVLKSSARPYPSVAPDLTKVIRSTEDALTGMIFRDDSQVVKQETSKVYVDINPGAQITIREIE